MRLFQLGQAHRIPAGAHQGRRQESIPDSGQPAGASSKPVKAWLAERTGRIEVFYLPSYSPELNPEERLNADLKQAMGKRVPVRTKAKLREAANAHMFMLEQSPGRVKSYVQDPRVKYAAG